MYTEQFARLRGLADVVDARSGSPGHAQRVSHYVQALLDALGLYGPQASQILVAARLHDVGKAMTPEAILQKCGPLTAEEWVEIKKHPEQGADMLMSYTAMAGAAMMVRSHHERPDGLGYPYKLIGPMIPIGARLIAVADSFDAMVTARPYNAGVSPVVAVGRLAEGADAQWDGTVVAAFIEQVFPRLDTSPGKADDWLIAAQPIAPHLTPVA